MTRAPVWPPMPDRAALMPPPLRPRRRREEPEPAARFQTVYLVGCGKQKRPLRAAAGELYTGSLFRAARQLVEARSAMWRILSARYGVLRPETVIDPYERRLPTRPSEVELWAASAATSLTSDPELRVGFDVVCLAGREYADPVCAVLEARGVRCMQPLRGMRLGHRLRWLKENREP